MIGLALGIWRFVPECESLKEAFQLSWARRAEMFVCILLANAPDIDLLFGVFSGDLNRYHHLGTHTMGWALATAFSIWLYGKCLLRPPAADYEGWIAFRNQPILAFWFVFILFASHLIIDIFTADTTPPYGIMFAWPFAQDYWHSPVSLFPAPAKKTVADIFSWHNLKNGGWEFVFFLPFVAVVLLSKVRKWPGNKRANIGGKN